MARDSHRFFHFTGAWFFGVAVATAGALYSVCAADVRQSASTSWRVPARAERTTNPVPHNDRAIKRGKALYVQECVACHGKTGRGDGPKAPDLRVSPGDFSRPATTRQSDGALFWKITRGRTPMPGYRTRLSDEERWMLVHFIRTLGKAESRIAPEKAADTKAAPEKSSPAATTNKVAVVAAEQMVDELKVAELTVAEQGPTEETAAESTQETEPADFVSRSEYEQLKSEHEALKQEFEAIKALLKAEPKEEASTAAAAPAAPPTPMRYPPKSWRRRSTNCAAGSKHRPPAPRGIFFRGLLPPISRASVMKIPFSPQILLPLSLWQLNDRILFEAELDFTLEESETDLDLERAQIYYVLNDYVTLGAGKFLSPMNFLEDRLHQVNKLPDRPVAIRELLPESNVGLQVRGGIPLGPTKLGYAFYAANAPELRDDPSALGTLDFENFSNDGGIAIGGRVGSSLFRRWRLVTASRSLAWHRLRAAPMRSSSPSI